MPNPPDLTRKDLSHVNLASANLAGADLHAATLRDATLKEANLEGADLTDADLTHANLAGACLRNASAAHATSRVRICEEPALREPSCVMHNGRPPRRPEPTSPMPPETESQPAATRGTSRGRRSEVGKSIRRLSAMSFITTPDPSSTPDHRLPTHDSRQRCHLLRRRPPRDAPYRSPERCAARLPC
jgi:hypothetical protein